MSRPAAIGGLAGAVLLVVLIMGCRGGPKGPMLSGARARAVELNAGAEKAYERGDYERALFLYEEALRLSRSVENVDGTAINMVNLALVHRKLGNRAEAIGLVDELLEADHVSYSRERLSEAAEVRALLHIDGGKPDKARQWAGTAMSHCLGAGCAWRGRLHNLRARVALMDGDYGSALEDGGRGLDLNGKQGDRRETANSLRIIADAKTAAGRFDEAKIKYEKALEIDKELGLSGKIAADLMGLGNALHGLKRHEEALNYFRRALSVSESGGDEGGIAEAARMIEKLTNPH
jgi:tetratricopeptide (TPR) repeat protein